MIDDLVVAREKALQREQLPQADAEREDVGALVDRQAAHLLGRHVPELALDGPHLRARQLARCLGDAEVDDLHVAVERHEDVLRRYVAVDEAERLAPGVAAGGARSRALRPLR